MHDQHPTTPGSHAVEQPIERLTLVFPGQATPFLSSEPVATLRIIPVSA